MAVIKKEEPKIKMMDMGYKYPKDMAVVDGNADNKIRYPFVYLDDVPKELYSKLKAGESFSVMIEGKVNSIVSREDEKKESYNCELEIHSMSIPE